MPSLVQLRAPRPARISMVAPSLSALLASRVHISGNGSSRTAMLSIGHCIRRANMRGLRARLTRPAAGCGLEALPSPGSIALADARDRRSTNVVICHPLTDKYPTTCLPHKRGIRFIGRNRELSPILKGKKYVRKFAENRIIESKASQVRPVSPQAMLRHQATQREM